jgi:hypothetical protein
MNRSFDYSTKRARCMMNFCSTNWDCCKKRSSGYSKKNFCHSTIPKNLNFYCSTSWDCCKKRSSGYSKKNFCRSTIPKNLNFYCSMTSSDFCMNRNSVRSNCSTRLLLCPMSLSVRYRSNCPQRCRFCPQRCLCALPHS